MHRYHHEDVTLSELANYSMAKIVEANLRHARSIQHPMEHMEHAVRGNRPAGGAGKYITAAGLLLPLLLQNAYRIRPQRDGSFLAHRHPGRMSKKVRKDQTQGILHRGKGDFPKWTAQGKPGRRESGPIRLPLGPYGTILAQKNGSKGACVSCAKLQIHMDFYCKNCLLSLRMQVDIIVLYRKKRVALTLGYAVSQKEEL